MLFVSSLSSSLILSKIKTFASTAIPTVKIIPAIPGRVKVASKRVRTPKRINKFIINVTFVIKPKNLYLTNIKTITNKNPIDNAIIPALIES